MLKTAYLVGVEAACKEAGIGAGVRELTKAAPAAARSAPGWAKMLGLGGLGAGAYYMGSRADSAPQADGGGFLGMTPDQGLQGLPPELLQLLLQQGLPNQSEYPTIPGR